MNALDIVILLAVVAAATGGWRRGIVERICTAVGVILGVLVAARNVSRITSYVPSLGDDPGIVGVIIAIGLGAIIGRIVGMLAGRWFKNRLPTRPLQTADRGFGAAAGAVSTLIIVWLSGPFLGLIPGWPSEQWRSSAIAAQVAGVLPAPPNPLGNARWAIGIARFPQIFTTVKEGADLIDSVGDLPIPTVMPGSVIPARTEIPGQVFIEADTCQVEGRGSGFVVAVPSLGEGAFVLTTAHQVAGASKLVIDDGRRSADGELVAIDTRADLAIVRVRGSLQWSPLVLAEKPSSGTLAVSANPISIVGNTTAEGKDIYGSTAVTREVLLVRGSVESDDIGAPILDSSGSVHGLVMALIPERDGAAVALRNAALRTFLADAASFPRTARCP